MATSTPQNSPQSTTNQNPSKLADEDVSFVSTIQDTSQVEAIAHYEHMIKVSMLYFLKIKFLLRGTNVH